MCGRGVAVGALAVVVVCPCVDGVARLTVDEAVVAEGDIGPHRCGIVAVGALTFVVARRCFGCVTVCAVAEAGMVELDLIPVLDIVAVCAPSRVVVLRRVHAR
jgi:hypothetical protein